MNILHFDFVPGIDDKYIQSNEGYTSHSFNQSYDEKDEAIELITCMHTSEIGPRVLDYFPHLRYVVTRTVGTNHIDKDFCDTHGIRYFSVGQYGPHVIATHALSLLLYGARDLSACHEMIGNGTYDYAHVRATDLSGKKIGVIGVGNIGKHILQYAGIFGMELYGYDIYEDREFAEKHNLQYVSLEKIFTSCDVICLACNLTPENTHLINEQAISSMKDGVILINIARGELIDEAALLAQIEKFSFVGLDVICDESALGIQKFLPYKNILLTPHIAHFADSTVRNRWNKTYEIINGL